MTEAVPTDKPVTRPDEPTVTVASLLLHVPPKEASFRLHCPPTHIGVRPVTGRIAFTVTTTDALHPAVPVE